MTEIIYASVCVAAAALASLYCRRAVKKSAKQILSQTDVISKSLTSVIETNKNLAEHFGYLHQIHTSTDVITLSALHFQLNNLKEEMIKSEQYEAISTISFLLNTIEDFSANLQPQD